MPKINATAESGNNSLPTAPRFEWEKALRDARVGMPAYVGFLLATFANGDGTGIYASQTRLAAGMNVDRGTVGKHLAELTEAGWLSCEGKRSHGQNEYRLTIPTTEPVGHTYRSEEEPVGHTYRTCRSHLQDLSVTPTGPVGHTYTTSTGTNPGTCTTTSPDAQTVDGKHPDRPSPEEATVDQEVAKLRQSGRTHWGHLEITKRSTDDLGAFRKALKVCTTPGQLADLHAANYPGGILCSGSHVEEAQKAWTERAREVISGQESKPRTIGGLILVDV